MILAADGKASCDVFHSVPFEIACEEQMWNTERCLYEHMIEQETEVCAAAMGKQDCMNADDYVACLQELALEHGDVALCANHEDCVIAMVLANNDGDLRWSPAT